MPCVGGQKDDPVGLCFGWNNTVVPTSVSYTYNQATARFSPLRTICSTYPLPSRSKLDRASSASGRSRHDKLLNTRYAIPKTWSTRSDSTRRRVVRPDVLWLASTADDCDEASPAWPKARTPHRPVRLVSLTFRATLAVALPVGDSPQLALFAILLRRPDDL
jgi:hypothetical protein